MDEWLNVEECIFDRNEKGEIIPQKVQLKGSDKNILITPLLAGEFKKYFGEKKDTSIDEDERIILEHCKTPKFTEEELKIMKKSYRDSIVFTILEHSDIVMKPKEEFKKKELVEVKEE